MITEPEIIPPKATFSQRGLSNENLDFLAAILDDMFQIPGTSIRFGLDALIGLFPGIGDVLTSIVSFLLVYAAWQRGLPRVTMARMLANIGIDTIVGAVPILGDAFDLAWKSNRKNYNLILRESAHSAKSQTYKDWLFLIFMVLALAAIISLPIVVLILLIKTVHG